MQDLTDNIYVLLILGMTGAGLLVVLFILLQVRGRNNLLRREKQLQEMEIQHQKELLEAVLLSQEAERSRIGMDLHDEVGTVLSSLRMALEDLSEPSALPVRSQAKSLIDQIMTSVRDISHDLSPFRGSAYGLMDALEDLSDRINRSKELVFSLDYAGGDTLDKLHRLSGTEALSLYRVLTELTQNTIKHAHAQNITLSFSVDSGRLLIRYRDDGRGLPAAGSTGLPVAPVDGSGGGKPGMGMRNIESRLNLIGAEYAPEGKAGQGFRIQIKLPIQPTSTR